MATLEQIATKAGVSRNTVARALAGQTKANWPSSARRVERIRKIAEDLGYRPNTAARATRTGRFNAIGVLRSIEAAANGINAGAMWTIEQEARRAGVHLVSGQVADADLTDENKMPLLLREWSADGLILSYESAPQRVLDLIDQYAIPVVWANTHRKRDCVNPDDRSAFENATRRLLKLGHRRVLYLGGKRSPHFSAAARYTAYAATMRDAGLQPVSLDESDPKARHTRLRELFESGERPTAVISLCQPGPAFSAALMAGLTVPTDLSVLAMRDRCYIDMAASESTFAGMDISAIEVPSYELGHEVYHMLMKKVDHPRRHLPLILLPFREVEGQTCAPPARVE